MSGSCRWLLASNPGLIRVWLLPVALGLESWPDSRLAPAKVYKFSPRFARKSKFKFHLQHFSECHALCFSRVCNTRPVNLCKHLCKVFRQNFLAKHSCQVFRQNLLPKHSCKVFRQNFLPKHSCNVFRPSPRHLVCSTEATTMCKPYSSILWVGVRHSEVEI